MKLSAIFLLAFCLQVSAGSFGQKISLSVKGEPLESVLKSIKKQTGVGFVYGKNLLKNSARVSLQVNSQSLDSVLTIIFNNQPLSYEISEGFVILSAKTLHAEVEKISLRKLIPIRGKVQDENGHPLAGATITIPGKPASSITNDKGQFVIEGDIGEFIIVSYVGYESRKIKISSEELGEIRLSISSSKLDETVVIAYGTSSKRLLTGNITKVSSQKIETQPISDPLMALQALVPGLQIFQRSGMPGRQLTIQLRGKNSISATTGTNPLFIIDNVPFFDAPSQANRSMGVVGIPASSPLNMLNPSDIESIEILKDADATAIYGSRAANGVILITTKKGNSDKTSVTASVNVGFGKVKPQMKFLNAQQYLEMRHEAFRNSNITTIPNNAYDLNGKWDTTQSTDWVKELIGGTANYADAQVSISGGTQKTRMLLSAGYHKDGSVFPNDYYGKRYSIHSNVNHQSSNGKLRVLLNATISNTESLHPLTELTRSIALPPVAPKPFDSAGKLNWAGSTWDNNPMALALRTHKEKSDYLNLSSNISYTIFSGLEARISLGYTTTKIDQTAKSPRASFNPAFQEPSVTAKAFTNNAGWNVEPQISYSKSFDKLVVEGLLGATFFRQSHESNGIEGSGFSNDNLLDNLLSASTKRILSSEMSLYKYSSGFTRLGARFDNKYLLNFTARRDGSSRFGPGKQFANFYAVGGAWIFSSENGVKNALPFLSFGKLRASYGTTGNDKIGDYQYLDSYMSYWYTYMNNSTLYPNKLNNPIYGWEVNKKLEFGLDFSLFKERLNVTSSFYRNRSSSQLLNMPLPTISGFSGILTNFPALVQNTGWEFEIKSDNINTENFRWSSAINLTIPKNKLVSYPDFENSTFTTQYVIGQPLYIFKALQYTGVNPKTGLYTFQDYNNDGAISEPDDVKKIIFTGQDYYGGIHNELQVKNWQLSFLFQFVKQNNVPNYRTYIGIPGFFTNQPIDVLDRWMKEGDITDIQKFAATGGQVSNANSQMRRSDLAYSDGSFIRLKNVQLLYKCPEKLLKKINASTMSVFLQAQNLFTITKYVGFDPETQGSLPPLKMITAGISISF